MAIRSNNGRDPARNLRVYTMAVEILETMKFFRTLFEVLYAKCLAIREC